MVRDVVAALGQGTLRFVDRFLPGYDLWQTAAAAGADLLWRVRQNARLDVDRWLPDGSYLSRIHTSTSDRRNQRKAIVVWVVDCRLHDVPGAEPLYRWIKPIPDRQRAPAKELAALHHERFEIGALLDELKTNPLGAQIVLRGRTPALAEQEFWAC